MRQVPELDVATATWLASDAGLAAVERTTAHLDDLRSDRAGQDPALIAWIRKDCGDPGRSSAVLAAAIARRRARHRWPDADRLLFTRESLEQASDPVVSRWRARRFRDAPEIWDLCAGIGGDLLALAEAAAAGTPVTAVDLDPARLVLLRHNANVRGLDVEVHAGDALRAPCDPSAWLHADPSRRVDGHRVSGLSATRPGVGDLLDAHRHQPAIAVVVAAGVAADDPVLEGRDDLEVEFVQVDTTLSEAVLWRGALRRDDATATASLLPGGQRRSRSGPRPERLPVAAIGDWLVDVVPAAVRARLHDDIGAEIGARRLARRRALLSCDAVPPASPWYRHRRVLEVLPARPKTIRAWLRSSEQLPVELVLHGMDVDPARWWRDLGRPPRGPQGLRIELVRLDTGAKAVITRAGADS